MAAGAKQDKNTVDVSKITFATQPTEIPAQVKGSKYPWAEILGKPVKEFSIPFESEDEANAARTSIQSSGRNFYTKRDLPFRTIARTLPDGKGKYTVHVWVVEKDGKEE